MHALGGRGGPHARGQRGGLVARGGVVMRDARQDLRADLRARRALFQRAGQRAVQLVALAGEQVVGDHLAQQRVAEGVAPVVLGDDEVAGDRLAQRAAQGGAVEIGGLVEQLVVEALADGERAQDLLRVLGQPLDAHHQRVAQRGGQRAAALAGGEQLLHEQRVALAARVEAVEQLGAGRRTEDVLQRGGELVAAQRTEGHAAHARVALQLGQQRAQGVAAVQLVEAVRADDEHALAAQRVGQEGDEGARGGVGPVEILEDQHDRALGAHAVQQGEQRLEEAALGGACVAIQRPGAGQPGEETGQLGAGAGLEGFKRGMPVAGERTQR